MREDNVTMPHKITGNTEVDRLRAENEWLKRRLEQIREELARERTGKAARHS
jgi:hypothetical protein